MTRLPNQNVHVGTYVSAGPHPSDVVNVALLASSTVSSSRPLIFRADPLAPPIGAGADPDIATTPTSLSSETVEISTVGTHVETTAQSGVNEKHSISRTFDNHLTLDLGQVSSRSSASTSVTSTDDSGGATIVFVATPLTRTSADAASAHHRYRVSTAHKTIPSFHTTIAAKGVGSVSATAMSLPSR